MVSKLLLQELLLFTINKYFDWIDYVDIGVGLLEYCLLCLDLSLEYCGRFHFDGCREVIRFVNNDIQNIVNSFVPFIGNLCMRDIVALEVIDYVCIHVI